MQPQSIKRFDMLYLGSIAVYAIAFFLGYDDSLAQMQAQMAGTGMNLGGGVLAGAFIFGVAISLLLWWLVSSRASAIAKWIIVVFFLFGLLGLPGLFEGGFGLTTILQLLAMILSAAAVYFMFQPDAKAWFDGDAPRQDTFE
ncbi:MAG TPA: hypothetical protein VLA37_14025 [Sphingomonadaceae bacterium]|nr:hypothetical protein [Sphingomonadaceae bacterium]